MAIIGFEGLNGVGKSTFARYTARSKGGVFIGRKQLPKGLTRQGAEVNNGFDANRRFNHYLLRNHLQMDMAREADANGRIAILDTTIYQTVIAHRILGSEAAEEYEIPDSLKPDLVIWLDCVERIRQKRVRGENRPPLSDWDRSLDLHQEDLRAGYSELGFPVVSTSGSFRQAQKGIHIILDRELPV